MITRLARLTDRETLLELGTLFFHASPHAPASVSADDLARIARTVDSVLNHGLCIVAEDRGGVVVGMLGLLVGPHPVTGINTAMEVAWFIHAANRGGPMAARLVRAAEIAARDAGAHRIQIGAPNMGVSMFLERLDYAEVERTYAKGLV